MSWSSAGSGHGRPRSWPTSRRRGTTGWPTSTAACTPGRRPGARWWPTPASHRSSSEAVTLVFAHRGASAELPEHTLAAYLRAIEQGADGIECDVRLTRDGHLVCIHDSRLDRTSNGSGRVSRARLAELELLDFGSWHTPVAATRSGEA